ncbi:hypothetical protein [Schlesneria paludicola]|uniref:hypothetical protein n=1 Tax=Schlesneria paludicola TaxID=360056 RepID=UPI000492930B|nr:hypothetical protein [Schlesneria paludicola]
MKRKRADDTGRAVQRVEAARLVVVVRRGPFIRALLDHVEPRPGRADEPSVASQPARAVHTEAAVQQAVSAAQMAARAVVPEVVGSLHAGGE